MPSFIEQINWVNLAKVPSPTNGIRRGDRKIGVMSEDLRRIYGMCLQVKSEEYSLAKKMSDIGDGVLKKKKSDFSLDKAQKHGESILSVTIELGNQVTLREVWTTLFSMQ